MTGRLRAALVGAGRVGAAYADDPLTARHFPFATHAQVLAAHPAIEWVSAVDPSEPARDRVRSRWGVPRIVADVSEIAAEELDLVVIATPPAGRLDLVRALPAVRGLMLEKPVAGDLREARAIVELCGARGIALQVALWRRGDLALRELADGRSVDLIGRPVGGFGTYGNGIRNNGIHMIDLVRMLVGEIVAVQALGPTNGPAGGGPHDVDVPFALTTDPDAVVAFLPLPFDRYREHSLEIWGDAGRFAVLQEGLRLVHHPVRDHRALSGAREIASEECLEIPSGAGRALYRLYDNLIAAIETGTELWSPGSSAVRAEIAIDALLGPAAGRGPVSLPT